MRLPRQGFADHAFSFGCVAGPDEKHSKLPGQFQVFRMLAQPCLEQFDGFREAVGSCEFRCLLLVFPHCLRKRGLRSNKEEEKEPGHDLASEDGRAELHRTTLAMRATRIYLRTPFQKYTNVFAVAAGSPEGINLNSHEWSDGAPVPERNSWSAKQQMATPKGLNFRPCRCSTPSGLVRQWVGHGFRLTRSPVAIQIDPLRGCCEARRKMGDRIHETHYLACRIGLTSFP